MRLSALLLAVHPGPRRICPPRAGGCRRRLRRCRAQRQRHERDDEDDGGAQGHAALRAAVPEGGLAGDRADRQHPALSRRAPRAGAEGGSRESCGCTSCSSPSPISCWRFTTPIIRSGRRCITRTSARPPRSARKNSGKSACRNISAISRGCWRKAAAPMSAAAGRPMSIFRCSRSWRGCATPFPSAWRRSSKKIPGLIELRDRVAERPNIKAYLASERRIAFNEEGIFRRYKALDL